MRQFFDFLFYFSFSSVIPAKAGMTEKQKEKEKTGFPLSRE